MEARSSGKSVPKASARRGGTRNVTTASRVHAEGVSRPQISHICRGRKLMPTDSISNSTTMDGRDGMAEVLRHDP